MKPLVRISSAALTWASGGSTVAPLFRKCEEKFLVEFSQYLAFAFIFYCAGFWEISQLHMLIEYSGFLSDLAY